MMKKSVIVQRILCLCLILLCFFISNIVYASIAHERIEKEQIREAFDVPKEVIAFMKLPFKKPAQRIQFLKQIQWKNHIRVNEILGSLYYEAKDYKQAIIYLTLATDFRMTIQDDLLIKWNMENWFPEFTTKEEQDQVLWYNYKTYVYAANILQNSYFLLGKTQDAVRYGRAILKILEGVPEYNLLAFFTANQMLMTADLQNKKFEEALHRLFEANLKIEHLISDMDEKNLRFVHENYYNIAALSAKLGKKRNAYTYLEKVIHLYEGKWRKLAVKDPDFDSIRNETKFIELINSQPFLLAN